MLWHDALERKFQKNVVVKMMLNSFINERYEKGSILLTSNRPPAEWPALLGDPLLASAGIDRFCHRAEIVILRGDSFRYVRELTVIGQFF